MIEGTVKGNSQCCGDTGQRRLCGESVSRKNDRVFPQVGSKVGVGGVMLTAPDSLPLDGAAGDLSVDEVPQEEQKAAVLSHHIVQGI